MWLQQPQSPHALQWPFLSDSCKHKSLLLRVYGYWSYLQQASLIPTSCHSTAAVIPSRLIVPTSTEMCDQRCKVCTLFATSARRLLLQSCHAFAASMYFPTAESTISCCLPCLRGKPLCMSGYDMFMTSKYLTLHVVQTCVTEFLSIPAIICSSWS